MVSAVDPIGEKCDIHFLGSSFMHCPGLPVGNPILGHDILGHFWTILGHFLYFLGQFGRNTWHWGTSLGSELHIFYEFRLCQSTVVIDVM